jgi:hypothetical protein
MARVRALLPACALVLVVLAHSAVGLCSFNAVDGLAGCTLRLRGGAPRRGGTKRALEDVLDEGGDEAPLKPAKRSRLWDWSNASVGKARSTRSSVPSCPVPHVRLLRTPRGPCAGAPTRIGSRRLWTAWRPSAPRRSLRRRYWRATSAPMRGRRWRCCGVPCSGSPRATVRPTPPPHPRPRPAQPARPATDRARSPALMAPHPRSWRRRARDSPRGLPPLRGRRRPACGHRPPGGVLLFGQQPADRLVPQGRDRQDPRGDGAPPCPFSQERVRASTRRGAVEHVRRPCCGRR